ncbi:hypothetical protein F4778DRAFT_482153 [Xylariomycetidae sp. FL2044]|nr:hypothetical protein F4778DRAFT_482153 [Xylariomycetidae sp. FL2044]
MSLDPILLLLLLSGASSPEDRQQAELRESLRSVIKILTVSRSCSSDEFSYDDPSPHPPSCGQCLSVRQVDSGRGTHYYIVWTKKCT